jgi:hypothetical protein
MDSRLYKFSSKFSVELVMDLVASRQYTSVSIKFMEIFNAYWDIFRLLDQEELDFLNLFIGTFLDVISKDNFIVPEEHVETYIRMSHHLAKLTALTEIKNTDLYLMRLLGKRLDFMENFIERNKVVKMLAMYSCHNELEINYKMIFMTFSDLASFWYWTYFESVDYVSELALRNLNRHIDQVETIGSKLNFNFHPPVIASSFSVSYINPDKDRKIKEKINSLLQEKFSGIKINNSAIHLKPEVNIDYPATYQPERKKIAVISSLLHPGHAVFKGTYQFIKSLANDYDLTMVHLRNMLPEDVESGYFDIFEEVLYLNLKLTDLKNSLGPLKNNNFDMVLYPDIGMSVESIMLSNLRLAPVQVTTHGHSVSTFGADIDYFISGAETEIIEDAGINYSERLVVIPGTGLQSAIPDYKIQNFKNDSAEFQIICPWSTQKINYKHLLNLKKIIDLSEKKIVFQIFSSGYESYLKVFNDEIGKILGPENVRVMFSLSYKNYMTLFEIGDISIDSFHYGGYNTIFDALHLSKPVVSLEGTKAYNKFASAVLRKLNLHELVASDEDEFVQKTVRLINDELYRIEMVNKIKAINLYDNLCQTDEPQYFKKAIDYLLTNHQQLKEENSRQPIIIE